MISPRTAEKNEDGTNTSLRSSSHDQLVDTKSLFLLDLLPTSVHRNLITERTNPSITETNRIGLNWYHFFSNRARVFSFVYISTTKITIRLQIGLHRYPFFTNRVRVRVFSFVYLLISSAYRCNEMEVEKVLKYCTQVKVPIH